MKIRPRDDTVLAVFDMEGTIISSNVVESYVWTRFADLPIEEWPAELVSVFGRIPGLPADRPSRPRRLPADVLPAVRGRERRRRRRAACDGHVAEFMLQKAFAGRRSDGSASTGRPGIAP